MGTNLDGLAKEAALHGVKLAVASDIRKAKTDGHQVFPKRSLRLGERRTSSRAHGLRMILHSARLTARVIAGCSLVNA